LKSIEIFVFKNQSNEQLTNDLQNEQKQINSYQIQIEKLTNEIHELEKTFEELKQEKNQLLFNKMDGDQDDERQNLVRQLTQEKDQYEQQIKEFRKQIKQINEDKDNISKQFAQIDNEKVKNLFRRFRVQLFLFLRINYKMNKLNLIMKLIHLNNN